MLIFFFSCSFECIQVCDKMQFIYDFNSILLIFFLLILYAVFCPRWIDIAFFFWWLFNRLILFFNSHLLIKEPLWILNLILIMISVFFLLKNHFEDEICDETHWDFVHWSRNRFHLPKVKFPISTKKNNCQKDLLSWLKNEENNLRIYECTDNDKL